MKVLALLLWLASPLIALAAEPFARASIAETTQFVAGQQIEVVVEVFAPDFFTSPPQYPLFEVPNALVTFSNEQAQNVLQTVDGVQYSGIRKVYAVVPQQSGSYMVPAITIALGWSNNGASVKGEVVTSPLSFDVAPSSQTDVAFAASGLEITQSFDRDPASLKVGGAIVRTVVVTAAETQSLAIPPVDVGVASGLKQYAKPPKLEDSVPAGRGDTVSRRTETIVYTAPAEGGFDLPKVVYPWFDVDAHSPATAALPAVQVRASKADVPSGIPPSADEHERGRPLRDSALVASVVGGVTVLLAFAWWARRRILALVSAADRVHRNSPSYRLRQLRKTIRSAEPRTIYASLHAWSREWSFPTLSAWLKTQPEPVSNEIAKLERALFGAGGGATILDRDALSGVRLPVSPRKSASHDDLPPLNPEVFAL